MTDNSTITQFINVTARTDALVMSVEATTSIYENRENKATRRLVYYILHGIVGLLVAAFNGLVIIAYVKHKNLRRHISMVMMNVFVFCFIHGLIVGIVYPLQRVYRYQMSSQICIFTTLLMDFADNYILILLPILAVERFIHLRYPNISNRKIKVWSIVSITAALLVTACYAWLPLVPELNIAQAGQISHDNKGQWLGELLNCFCDNKDTFSIYKVFCMTF